jgi:histidyl-tRNA synthetase
VEHHLHDSPLYARLYYIGPQFRYERPQKGRLRQFHQIGAEVLGDAAPGTDAETIGMLVDFLEKIGVVGVQVVLNSVGCPACRPAFVALLKGDLAARAGELCGDCRRRLETNPLRVLDCKVPSCQPILDGAPAIADNLCEACTEHHGGVKAILSGAGVPFTERARLVRGLDYYTRTVFELTSSALGAQDALLGGGRYDGLLEEIGGPSLPGFGWALGMERLLMVIPPDPPGRLPWVYLAWMGEAAYGHALRLARRLRGGGRVVILEHAARSFKSSLKRADRMNCNAVLIIGEEEAASGIYTLKDLDTHEQSALDEAALCSLLRGMMP